MAHCFILRSSNKNLMVRSSSSVNGLLSGIYFIVICNTKTRNLDTNGGGYEIKGLNWNFIVINFCIGLAPEIQFLIVCPGINVISTLKKKPIVGMNSMLREIFIFLPANFLYTSLTWYSIDLFFALTLKLEEMF